MIRKSEILSIASDMALLPNIIEKDYALSWMLAGIFAHTDLRENWIFKGGTCLKKCYFKTYRFSEDLDFTLRNPNHIDTAFLERIFTEITDWINAKSGIEFRVDQRDFDIFTNSRGYRVCQCKISYRGPISPRRWPRIKLDLSADECIVLPPINAAIFHPYTDKSKAKFNTLAYAYEEIFGEKVRALMDRTRPRDLYDVINLFKSKSLRTKSSILRNVIQKKCQYKKVPMPNLEAILVQHEELHKGWKNMLAHQMPTLPALENYLDELPAFFDWLYPA